MRNEILEPGTIVQHFKRELIPKKDRKFNDKYLYRVIRVALDTTTNKKIVVYDALYENEEADFILFTRPLEEFMSEVDKTKYPNIKSKYRFTKYIGD